MRVKTLSLPFGKINANRIYWEVGIAPVLCRQALAHVPAVSCRSSDYASPGDHHAWLDSKPRRYTDSSVILTPLWHYRERNSVQRGETREGKPAHLCGTCKPVQTPATSELSLVAGARKRFESTTRLTVWCHLP